MEELGIDQCFAASRTGRGGGVILLIKKYKGRIKVCVCVSYGGKRLCTVRGSGFSSSSVGW